MQIQRLLKKMMIRKKLMRLTKQLIPLCYHKECRGGYFYRKKFNNFQIKIELQYK